MAAVHLALIKALELGHRSDAQVVDVRPRPIERRADQITEERMRAIRTALELGVRLGRHPERVIGEFDELDETSVGRDAAADEPVFLELNPAGEWGWLERDLELPISAAIAEALLLEREAA